MLKMESKSKLTYCSFCSYRTISGCTVTPDSHYCKQAKDEFFRWLKEQKNKK